MIAEQKSAPWTWTTQSGQVMQADSGDWELRDADGGQPWSVRDNIFRAAYENLDGTRWRRRGVVKARPAHGGETIDTLEGPAMAADGDWVVQGEQGEQWPVPGDQFRRRYDGPVTG